MKTKLFTLVTLAIFGLISANAQVGIGTENPNPSAILDVVSETKGFLMPRVSQTERNNIDNPTPGLIVYNTDQQSLNIWLGYWRNLAANASLAGNQEIYSPETGLIWMDRNLGANQVATSPTDAAAYGDLYQWGRAKDGHEDRLSQDYIDIPPFATEGVASFEPNAGNDWDGEFIIIVDAASWVDTSATDSFGNGVDDLWQGVNGVNNPCPADYRLPTEAEWLAESENWDFSNPFSEYFEPLKLPLAGSRFSEDGTINGEGADVHYWSSTISGTDAKAIFISSFFSFSAVNSRAEGFSVRCVKD